MKIKDDVYIINKNFVKGKSKYNVSWLVLILYLLLLFVNVFHVHHYNFKISSQQELSNQEYFIDPYQDESGICRVEHFFNNTFNAQLKSSFVSYLYQTLTIIKLNFIFNPLKKFLTSATLRSPPHLF
ncbi:hypothetical protein [Rosettibacter firmus]|uniref:hypothetical protein n=1 Tax=Rosettibacter firmus TaxID=3111522 RepID=UPI00336BEE4C